MGHEPDEKTKPTQEIMGPTGLKKVDASLTRLPCRSHATSPRIGWPAQRGDSEVPQNDVHPPLVYQK